ncbi:hypothetical protein [Gynuella sunshinyii]|uniref:Uncharacterized protein n=1 Tax=Gynuella sunshinyii YC6258 TaxID=1445510 RepID=A0A0C5VKH4_9GAMM|nr:hypothetical protein [Gynuella sunshinyii]AJQ94761.1 hypothetical Protein YC6258_02723 [Gynuella sunshinyii YC6258]
MKKVLSIVILAIVLLGWFAQRDDELSEQATQLISRLEADTGSASYLYLYGIYAKESENPEQVGRRLLAEYQKSVADESYEFVAYPDSDRLPLPRGEAFCRSWEDGCLEYLFSSEIDADALLAENKMLVFRSNKFHEFNEYKTLSEPTVSEIYPPYQYITAAERIKTIEAISFYKNGDARKALDSLSGQLMTLRKSMELQDNLVGKMVFLMKLSEILDVSSVILANENIRAENIPSLSESEKSFYMIVAREFGMSYHTIQSLDKNPEFFEEDANFPGWITRMLYKPNMTINAVTPIYIRLERLARLSPSELVKQFAAEKAFKPSTSKIRNYIGAVLIELSPDFDEYVARFSDLEAKLALYNQVHNLQLKPGVMHNPYYGNETPEEVDGSLCFSGPLEDKKRLRCLRVKL